MTPPSLPPSLPPSPPPVLSLAVMLVDSMFEMTKLLVKVITDYRDKGDHKQRARVSQETVQEQGSNGNSVSSSSSSQSPPLSQSLLTADDGQSSSVSVSLGRSRERSSSSAVVGRRTPASEDVPM